MEWGLEGVLVGVLIGILSSFQLDCWNDELGIHKSFALAKVAWLRDFSLAWIRVCESVEAEKQPLTKQPNLLPPLSRQRRFSS